MNRMLPDIVSYPVFFYTEFISLVEEKEKIMKYFILEHWGLLAGIFFVLLINVVCHFIITYYMLRLIKASEKLEEESQKLFKNWIEEYLNEKQRITNTTLFVEKKLTQLSIGKCKLSWIKHISGQTMLIGIFLAGIGACRGIIMGKTLGQILPFYIISLFSLYLHFSLSGIMDIEGKKKIIEMNLADFLENGKTWLYMTKEIKKGVEEERYIYDKDEDLELKEIIREILV